MYSSVFWRVSKNRSGFFSALFCSFFCFSFFLSLFFFWLLCSRSAFLSTHSVLLFSGSLRLYSLVPIAVSPFLFVVPLVLFSAVSLDIFRFLTFFSCFFFLFYFVPFPSPFFVFYPSLLSLCAFPRLALLFGHGRICGLHVPRGARGPVDPTVIRPPPPPSLSRALFFCPYARPLPITDAVFCPLVCP